MAANIKLKRSAVQSKVPTTSDLELGELGLNTYDGKVYMKKDDGTASIVEVGSGGGSSDWTEGTNVLYPTDSSNALLIGGTLPSSPNIELGTDGAIDAAADATINGMTVGLGGGSGSSNVAFGFSALNSNTTGLYNVAIGRSALTASNANSNTAIGHNTLLVNTTGAANLAIGRQALKDNTEGGNNVAVGYRSLFVNTTGIRNTAIGYSSLQNNLTGSENTAIGRYAGRYIEGSNNTILGNYEGTTADSTLSDTVIIAAGTAEKLRIDSTGSLLFGGTLPGTPDVTINSDGSAEFAGKITSDSTVSGDAGTILATKDYVDALAGGINSTIAGMIF